MHIVLSMPPQALRMPPPSPACLRPACRRPAGARPPASLWPPPPVPQTRAPRTCSTAERTSGGGRDWKGQVDGSSARCHMSAGVCVANQAHVRGCTLSQGSAQAQLPTFFLTRRRQSSTSTGSPPAPTFLQCFLMSSRQACGAAAAEAGVQAGSTCGCAGCSPANCNSNTSQLVLQLTPAAQAPPLPGPGPCSHWRPGPP